jgi:hypothetical protein
MRVRSISTGLCGAVLIAASVALAMALSSSGVGGTAHDVAARAANDVPDAKQSAPQLGNWAGLDLPDGTRGYVFVADLAATKLEGMTADEGLQAVEAQRHKMVPVTREKAQSSLVVGYVVANVGFIDLATAQAPDFDLDVLIAEADAKQQRQAEAVQERLETSR